MINRVSKRMACLFIALAAIVSMMSISVFAAEAKLSKTSVSVTQGKTTEISVSGASDTIKWSVSDKNVATVSKGTIKGVAPGTTTVTATVGSKKLTCKVTVYTNKIVPKSSKATVKAGKTGSINITIKGVNDVVCGTTDKTIATAKLDKENGKLKITGVKAGTAKIKVYSKSDSTISRTITVTVEKGSSTSTTKSTGAKGSISNNVYTNTTLNMQFKMKNIVFLEGDTINDAMGVGNFDGMDLMFTGVDASDFSVIIGAYMDLSQLGSESATNSDIKAVTELIAENPSLLGLEIGKGTSSSCTLAGKTYYTASFKYEGYYVTIAFRMYGDKCVMILHMSETNNFKTVAKNFTAID